jgi:hypothetical protein
MLQSAMTIAADPVARDSRSAEKPEARERFLQDHL